MKIVGCTVLHYGKTFLSAAIRSIINEVDEHYILYAPRPSHGHRSSVPCPDSEDELHEIAWQAAGSKLRWKRGDWLYENEQRNSIFSYAPDADAIVIVDSDEAWEDGLVDEAIGMGIFADVRTLRIPFVHMWRTFKRGFAHDPAYPERVIFPKHIAPTMTLATDKRIWHYGYCQPSEIVEYKIRAHGHSAEFRTDCDWFKDVFMANRQTDCHPIGSEFWNCEDIDLTHLPSVLRDHPLKDVELIP